ncbi:MAG: 1-acyl-sn-glycerol-3-phosphate acyltransferase [Acaryochloridaceae cyanobacterium SU_2_1]|nr:1-acyl-sn-glycerol-3-phosphate acyltransferase [Acaryochloridaceae cyanobacterium SU_2_1]NJM95120.1 1-acyl-sn-glycerol-3-phosphate acyltransferase [Acaryochloridaceae cyanobacterium CSU_5_19]
MSRLWKFLFFLLVARGIVFLIGWRIHHRYRLPRSGPAILVANHNSHLDTLILMSLFPLSQVHHLRPVADQHYFLEQNRCLAWFSRQVLDIIPVPRHRSEGAGDRNSDSAYCGHRAFLKNCEAALHQNQIVIFYPEGTRGQPEALTPFNSGVAHLAKHHPQVPLIPIFLQGLGKVLPKGEFLLVPFLCQIVIGNPLYWSGNKPDFLKELTDQIQALSREADIPIWE